MRQVTFFVLLSLLCSVPLAVSADDVVKKMEAIRQRQRDAELQSLKTAWEEANKLYGELVIEGQDRSDLATYRDDLKARISMIEGNVDKDLEKEFEAVEDRGGWWWIDGNKRNEPNPMTQWYRLDKAKKQFKHFYKDPAGKTVYHAGWTWQYQVIGLDPSNSNIIKIDMIDNQGLHHDFRFNRKTKEVEGDGGWLGIPK